MAEPAAPPTTPPPTPPAEADEADEADEAEVAEAEVEEVLASSSSNKKTAVQAWSAIPGAQFWVTASVPTLARHCVPPVIALM